MNESIVQIPTAYMGLIWLYMVKWLIIKVKWYISIAIYFENSFVSPDLPKRGRNRATDGIMEFS